MTKGQFAALTVALGLATMAGSGYIAYASSSSGSSARGADAGGGASSGDTTAPDGGATNVLPTDGPSASLDAGKPTMAAGVTASAGAATSGASGGKGGASTADAPACGGNDIQVSTTDDQGAAGHISLVLVFINTGTHACVLSGYPGAELVGQNDADLLDAQRTLSGYSGGAVGLSSAPPVLLSPQSAASAVLEWIDVPSGSGPNGGCAAPDPISLAVTPPNTKQSTTIQLSAKSEVCGDFEVHPVLAGVTRTP
jgi:hypothetical protein